MRASTRKTGLGVKAATLPKYLLPVLLLLIAASPLGAGDYPSKCVTTRFPRGDGRIVIYSYHLDETLVTTYRTSDVYDETGLQRIASIFRSRSDQKTHRVDIILIELLDHLQDHFEADSIELISGYRSRPFNAALAKSSGDVAEESMHVHGRAADVHIDEVTEEIVADYVRSLKVGGVGYYPARDFVHIDTGDVRNWDLADEPGRRLIAMRQGIVWQIITDRDIHLPGEEIDFGLTNTTGNRKKLRNAPILQIFRRGMWTSKGPLPVPKDLTVGPGETWNGFWKPSAQAPFGKYRIVITESERFPHLEARSNEFYRKRR
jgi:uncharacterized protein YcbK (DUF882 family)